MNGNRRAVPAAAVPLFPLMQIEEICNCLHALGIVVQPEDLTKPTATGTQAIYAGLLEQLMGAPTEMLDQPRSALMGMMEYKEIYSDALQFSMFYKHVRHLAITCHVTDFHMADMTRPEAGRMRKILSGFMNFAKFRDEKLHYRDLLQQKLLDSQEKTERLRNQLDAIDVKIKAIAAKSAADRPETERIRKQNEALRAELYELRSQQVKLSHEVEEVKREKDSTVVQAQAKQHELSSIQLQISSTRSRLVQSPDRIKRHISEMSSTVAAEKAGLASFQRKARELGNRLEVIGGLEMDLKGLIDLEKGIEAQRGKLEEARRREQMLEGRKAAKRIESESLKARLEQLDRQLQNAADKQVRQQEMSRDMQERATKKIDALKAQYVVRAKERGAWQKEQQHLLAEQKVLEDEMAAFLALHEGEINDLLQEYWAMRGQAEDYMSTMTAQLGLQVKA